MFRISCIAYSDDGCLLDVGRRLPLQRVWSDYALDKSSMGQNKPILPNSWQFHSNVAAGAWLFVGLRTQTSWSHATSLSHHYIRLDPNILLNRPNMNFVGLRKILKSGMLCIARNWPSFSIPTRAETRITSTRSSSSNELRKEHRPEIRLKSFHQQKATRALPWSAGLVQIINWKAVL